MATSNLQVGVGGSRCVGAASTVVVTTALAPFIVAVSVILTATFHAARGTLPVAFLLHAQLDGRWLDAQPWDIYLSLAIAILVVVVSHKAMLIRGTGAAASLART